MSSGEIKFKQKGRDDQAEPDDMTFPNKVAELMGVNADEMMKVRNYHNCQYRLVSVNPQLWLIKRSYLFQRNKMYSFKQLPNGDMLTM